MPTPASHKWLHTDRTDGRVRRLLLTARNEINYWLCSGEGGGQMKAGSRCLFRLDRGSGWERYKAHNIFSCQQSPVPSQLVSPHVPTSNECIGIGVQPTKKRQTKQELVENNFTPFWEFFENFNRIVCCAWWMTDGFSHHAQRYWSWKHLHCGCTSFCCWWCFR